MANTPYDAYLLATAGLCPTGSALYSMTDGSGAVTMADIAPNPDNGLYANAPDLAQLSDEYGAPLATCLRASVSAGSPSANKIGYFPVGPGHKVNATSLGLTWTFSFWAKSNGSHNGLNSHNMFGFADTASLTSNFLLGMALRQDGTNNHAVIGAIINNAANTGAEYIDINGPWPGTKEDGITWNLYHFGYKSNADDGGNGGSLYCGMNGEWGTPRTGVAAKIAALTLQSFFGIGEVILADGTFYGYGAGFDFRSFGFHAGVFLTATQLLAMGKVWHGDTGAKVEFQAVARSVLSKARTMIVPHLGIGDSNIVKPTAADNVTAAQGFILTTATWMQAVTSQKLTSHLVSGQHPGGIAGAAFLGVSEQLMATPNGTAPAYVTALNLEQWNTEVALAAGTGFTSDARYFASGTLAAADSLLTCATGNNFWMMDSPLTLSFYYYYGGFASGSGQIVPTAIVNGTIINFTPTSTNTGIAGWFIGSIATGNVPLTQSAQFGFASTGHDGTGPLATAYVHIDNAARATGFSLGIFWNYAGHGCVDVCQGLADNTRTPLAKVTGYFLALSLAAGRTGQGAGNTRVVIQILQGPNDRDDGTQASWLYTRGTDTFTNNSGTVDATHPDSFNRFGYLRNLKTICDRLLDAAVAAGFTESNIYFQFGPYHQIATPGDWKMECWYARAERDFCRDYRPGNGFRVDGPNNVPYATMLAAGGYDDTGVFDSIHLKYIGYALLGATSGANMAPLAAGGAPRDTTARKLLIAM